MALKRNTVIRLWLWLIASIVLSIGLLTQCVLNKAQLIAHTVDDCAKNVPFSKVWNQDLIKYGIDDNMKNGLPEYYCQCTLGEPLHKLSDEEMKAFIKGTEEVRLQKLGGEKGLQQRNDDCLQNWKKQQTSTSL